MGAHATALVRLRDDGRLQMVAGAGAFELPELKDHTVPVERGLIGRCVRERRVVLAPDVMREPDYTATAATADVCSELDAPVLVDGRPWGALTLQSTFAGAFDDGDANMLRAAAHQLSAGLRLATLHSRLERAQRGTAEALRAALDARVAATAEGPTSLIRRCEAVGLRLGMGEHDLAALRQAATLHDIGELGVPEAILNKPGPLTADERPAIERHPLIGEGILSPLEFLADAIPLVRAGHERWDGTGYPDGLAGVAIPLESRIVSCCDAFDAMTTDRSYRPAMTTGEALEELRRNAGTQFDPGVAWTLIELVEASEKKRFDPMLNGAGRFLPAPPEAAPLPQPS
jgi:hypothetical protein